MEPCKFEDEIINTGKTVARMEEKLDNAIANTTNHIIAGAKYRLAIICSCIGLIGIFLGGIIKFAVNDYKVTLHDKAIEDLRDDNRDLNFEIGKVIGVSEKK